VTLFAVRWFKEFAPAADHCVRRHIGGGPDQREGAPDERDDELGAVDAMNLDGGGSTTMFLDGKVVNKPSDKEGERKVSDALLVTLRKKS